VPPGRRSVRVWGRLGVQTLAEILPIVGGVAPAIEATLKSPTLGELELRDLPAAFATPSDGACAFGAGQLGAGVQAPATPSRPGQGGRGQLLWLEPRSRWAPALQPRRPPFARQLAARQ
jgi:hypothetical protein